MDFLNNIVKDFYACTQLVARAFDRFGNCVVVCSGENRKFCCVPEWREAVFNALEDLYKERSITRHITRSCPSTEKDSQGNPRIIYFTVCYVAPQTPELGAIAFGPYIPHDEKSPVYPSRPFRVVEHLVELLQMIARKNLPADPVEQLPVHYSYRTRLAINYVHNRLPAPVTLSETAEAIQTDKTYLSRIFRKETGMSFSSYINEMRVAHSRNLLANSSLSLLDVSLAVGFNDQSYFSRIFKKVVGVTPQLYRKSTACGVLPETA